MLHAIVLATTFGAASVSADMREHVPRVMETPASVSEVRLKRVRLQTGIELEVAETGPVGGRPVLFLHGFPDSWFSYTRVLEHLPANIRAIVPTQRGHGDSERPACCYRIADFAADAVALLDALGVQRADIVGHSMGSMIAQRIAINHPERVNRLVLVGSGTTVRTPPVLEFNDVVQKLTDPIPAGFAREFQVSTVNKPLPPAFLDHIVKESEKLPARVWRDVLAGLVGPDAQHEQARIQAQTLIVWGDKDALFDRAQQDGLLRTIRSARLIVYYGIGHGPVWEEPERFAGDLMNFLDQPAAATTPEQHVHAHAHTAHNTAGSTRLLPGLGDWRHTITAASEEAQLFFDQGLRLSYAFNHDEAIRSFEQAVQLDSTCAMCYWGIAYALGPNINLPMDPKAEPRAVQAIRQAQRYKGQATLQERALIDAMALRYGEPAGAARSTRDSAYAAALRTVVQQFQHDPDVNVLFADAMLNLRPWNQWTRDGRPHPGTEEVIGTLELVLSRVPNHAGACHLYVHAIEASQAPERALPCAERLPRLMPGAGHVVHMPAHIYLRVGRYQDAAGANIAAIEADHRFLGDGLVKDGFYPLFYAPHNLHFLWATYLLSGQRDKALQAARSLVSRVDLDDARNNGALEGFLPSAILTLARFGEWDRVLAEMAPPSDLRYVKGMWHYARGLAQSARSNFATAAIELDSVRAIAGQVKDDLIIILNPAPALLKLAAEVLAGDIAAKQKRFSDAIAHLYKAAQLEDELTYDEPPPWYHSARNMLGEVLLRAGRAAEAERVFREDLRHVRETGWSLSGLERALRAQGKAAEAAQILGRFKAAWKYADSSARP